MRGGSKTPVPALDAEEILAATFVRHAEFHNTLGSTNVRALELARNTDIELPALVIARLQTAGKGRGHNSWWAADGALTFSLLLDESTTGIAPNNWPRLSLSTAVAVCDGLDVELTRSTVMPPLQIRWPNDVLMEGRKICGILVESPGGITYAKRRLIVGIGININNSWRAAPHELGISGTALCDFTGRDHDLQSVLVGLLNAIAQRMDQLRHDDTKLFHAWQKLNYLAGRRVAVETNSGKIYGVCEEIAQDGALVLAMPTGQRRFYSGSVRLA